MRRAPARDNPFVMIVAHRRFKFSELASRPGLSPVVSPSGRPCRCARFGRQPSPISRLPGLLVEQAYSAEDVVQLVLDCFQSDLEVFLENSTFGRFPPSSAQYS
jgi:hypothetical protein